MADFVATSSAERLMMSEPSPNARAFEAATQEPVLLKENVWDAWVENPLYTWLTTCVASVLIELERPFARPYTGTQFAIQLRWCVVHTLLGTYERFQQDKTSRHQDRDTYADEGYRYRRGVFPNGRCASRIAAPVGQAGSHRHLRRHRHGGRPTGTGGQAQGHEDASGVRRHRPASADAGISQGLPAPRCHGGPGTGNRRGAEQPQDLSQSSQRDRNATGYEHRLRSSTRTTASAPPRSAPHSATTTSSAPWSPARSMRIC